MRPTHTTWVLFSRAVQALFLELTMMASMAILPKAMNLAAASQQATIFVAGPTPQVQIGTLPRLCVLRTNWAASRLRRAVESQWRRTWRWVLRRDLPGWTA